MLKKYLFIILCLSLLAFTVGCTEEQKTEPQNQQSSQAASVMEDFQALTQKEPNIEAIAKFMGDNISQVTKENATEMVLQLEKVQQKQLPQFEELFIQEGLEEKMAKEYKTIIENPEGITDAEVKDLISKTQKSGYRVETAEGMFFPIIDYAFYEKYLSYVTEDIREYLEIMAVESAKVPAKDAALVIGWDEVIKRAVQQEKFMDQYPTSVKVEEVKELYKRYLTFTLYGLNNTPLFSYENNIIDSDAKAAYLQATQDIGNSKYLQTVAEYLEVINKNDDSLSPEVKQYRDEVNNAVAN